MDPDHEHYHKPTSAQKWWKTKTGIIIVFFLGAAAYSLLTEHLAHVIYILPWLIILLCPIMHLFMHGGHGGHDDDHQDKKQDKEED